MNDLTWLNTAEGSESLNLTGHSASLMARLASQVETKASWLGMAWLAVSRVGFRCLKEWAKFGLKRGKRWRKDEKGWTLVYMDRKPSPMQQPCKQSRLRNGEDWLKEDSQQYSKQKWHIWQKTNSTHLKLNFVLGRLYCRVINAHWFEHISVQRFYTKAMFTHCITWWQHNRIQ